MPAGTLYKMSTYTIYMLFFFGPQGYIHQARRHPAMFSENRIRILFGNLEDIYNVSKQFVTDLEKSYNSGLPHLTEVGQCFLNSVSVHVKLYLNI